MWAAWRLCGAHARDCLARVVPVDLDPDIFQVGNLALTRAGHLDVRICRIEADAYEITVTRSTAADLLHALSAALRGHSDLAALT
jgi:sarcosine oxidase subunit gamma